MAAPTATGTTAESGCTVPKKPGHGGARKGAGRPQADDKSDHVVSFRLDSWQMERATKAAGELTVHALAKKMLLEHISKV